jgi:RNA polymerase sigma-70 factor (ECF subfamily)
MRSESFTTGLARLISPGLPAATARNMSSAADDFEIVDQIWDGNSEAFGILVRRYENFVFTLVCGIVGSEENARDITQEVFLRSFKAIRTYGKKASFKTWLYRIAYNCSMSHLARNKLRAEQLNEGNAEIVASDENNLPLRQKMSKLINKLNPEHKAVIIFHYYDNLKYEEIAEILRCPLGTVKIRLFRARNELKKLWDNHAL